MSKFDRRMRCQHSKETIGLAVIAKNEEDALPTLLGSIQGAFDKIAFVDTGSTDNTVRLFEGWARAEVEAGRLDSYVSDYFEWCDDFSAARNYADNLLDTDWLSWADAEDVIAGAQNLRHVAASDDAVNAWFAEWDYSDRFPRVLRERLVRRGRYTWQGRIHENLNIDEGIEHVVDPSLVRWVHLCDGADDEERYRTRMRILSRWVEEEPDNAWARWLLANEVTHGELLEAELRGEAKRRTVKKQSAPASVGADPGHDQEVSPDA